MGLKGTNAGFTYTPPGGTQTTVNLQYPLKLGLRPGLTRRRATSTAWGTRSTTTFRSSASRQLLTARARFMDNPKAFLDFLDSASVAGATYFPDLALPTSYDVEILDVGTSFALDQDRERWFGGEYEYRLTMRAADDVSLAPLYTP